MSDPERLIVEALKAMERDPEGPRTIAKATAYAAIATAMLLRQFLHNVPVMDMDDDDDLDTDRKRGPEW